MVRNDRPLITVGVAMLALILGLYLGATLDSSGAREWIQAVGPTVVDIFGWLIAGVAAALAWRAVQRQIASDHAIDTRREREARLYLCGRLREPLRLLNIVWANIEVALHKGDRTALRRAVNGGRLMAKEMGRAKADLGSTLDSVIKDMAWRDRYLALELVDQYRRCISAIAEASDDEADVASDTICISASHVHEAARRFDPELLAIFVKRKPRPVNWLEMSELIEMSDAAQDY